jgi:hypothetical protein
MHNEIRKFGLTGTITSGNFMSARDALIKEVEGSMRDEGFVPVLDLMPQFTRVFDPVTEQFDFELSVYGTYVGDNAWEPLGILNGILQKRSTQPAK